MEMKRVKKAIFDLYFKCPLCTKTIKNVTTITECMDKFCRDCIYKKITEEKLNACPVCNVDLGCAPLEKLRSDHLVEQIKQKVYRPRQKKITPPIDTIAPSSNETNSLSSSHVSGLPKPVLVNSASTDSNLADEKEHASLEPNVPRTQPVRKSRKGKKKVSKAAKSDTKLDSKNQSSSKIVSNIVQDNEPDSLTHNDKATSSKGNTQKKNKEFPNISDLLNSLNSSAKSEEEPQNSKKKDQKTIFLSDQQATGEYVGKSKENVENNQSNVINTSNVDISKTSKDKGKEINLESSSSGVVLRPRKCKNSYIEKTDSDSDVAEVIRTSEDTQNEVTGGRNVPIWFTLIASKDTYDPLPQISPRYLRVKDRNLPVLFIQKYIAKKLNLASEAEVEIWLRHDEAVPSSQELHKLLDWWIQTTTPAVSEQVSSSVGTSAAEFVMELFYTRKSHL